MPNGSVFQPLKSVYAAMGTDGCSGGVSWFWKYVLGNKLGGEYCCEEHDLAYDEGGSADDRLLADQRLRSCMIEAGYPIRAEIFYTAVRLFGWTPWHWRYFKNKRKNPTPNNS